MDTMPDFDVGGDLEDFVDEDPAEMNHGKMPSRNFSENEVCSEPWRPSLIKLERAGTNQQVFPGRRQGSLKVPKIEFFIKLIFEV